MKKNIVNIGTIDARGVTNEVVQRLAGISNVGTLILDDQSEALLLDVAKTNIGSVIKTQEDLEILTVNSKMQMDAYFFKNFKKKMLLTVNGKLELTKDIDPCDLEASLLQGTINGKVIAPKNISGIIKSNLAINGDLLEYDPLNTFVDGTIYLDTDFLATYFGDRKIAVQKLVVTEDLDPETLRAELDHIEVLGKLIVSKSNIKVLKPLLSVNQNKVKLIPDHTLYLEEDAVLDSALIGQARGRNILVEGNLTILSLEELRALKETRLSAKKILCHDGLIDKVRAYCSDDYQVIESTVKENLENYSDFCMDKAYLLSFDEAKKYENYGTLTFADDLEELDLSQVKVTIENYGSIQYKEDLETLVNQLVISNYGKMTNLSDQVDKDQADETFMYANMGFLAL